MQIVTGYRGQAHITSNDDQGRNQGVFGQNSYVLSVGSQFAPTLVSANELRIADGEAVMQGVHFRVDPSSFDSVTITNGTQGMNRKDLVVCRYTKDGSTGVENCEWVVIEGTPTSGTAARPSAVSGDILDGALVADMPFFEIVLSGINVTAVNSLFSKLMTMQETQALAKTNESDISELNSKIAYENFSTQIAFESGAPSSYAGYADISIGKTGYTPISVSFYNVPGSASIDIYSLQMAVPAGTARITYGRNGGGAGYSNTVVIRVVYIKN